MDTLLTSRKFWISVLSLLVVILQVFVPSFNIDQDAATGFLIIIGTYIVSVSIDPGNGWKEIAKSRKFWAAVAGLILVFLYGFGLVLPYDMTPEQFEQICFVIGSYIIGVSLEGKWDIFKSYVE
ncbi:MAG: hypothetical protein HPY87_08830, partial [Fervidobacterium sp.]|uniref:hypothetical protein n=1 Tax=Fervidobacterium sp. TaxID=1871331 RepID=UPI0025C45C61